MPCCSGLYFPEEHWAPDKRPVAFCDFTLAAAVEQDQALDTCLTPLMVHVLAAAVEGNCHVEPDLSPIALVHSSSNRC